MKIEVENGNVSEFTFVLSSRNHTHYGQIINIEDALVSLYLNQANEISFTIHKEVDNKKERLWDEIIDFRLVWVKELNEYFEISVSLCEGDTDTKRIVGRSLCECELSQKILYNLEINTETDIAREDYSPTIFYNGSDHKSSLIHRVLEKAPAYTIKHIDASLMTIQRTFAINGTSIYDFLIGECAKEFNCIFLFNSVERSISVYDLYTYCNECGHREPFFDVCPKCGGTNLHYFGEDTTIFVSKDNLTEEIKYEINTDNVKNCFRLVGGDDVMTATITSNIPTGENYIMYFSDEQKRDMTDELVSQLESYNDLYDSNISKYTTIMQNIYNCIDEIIYYESKMMPSIEQAEVTSATEAEKINKELDFIALQSVTTSTSVATVNSAIKNYAKVFVHTGRVKLDVENGVFNYKGANSSGYNYGIWTGKIKVTSYADKEDVSYTSNLTVTVTNDYEGFVDQKIKKNVAKNSDNESGIFDVLIENDLTKFKLYLTKYCLERLTSFHDAIESVLGILNEENQGTKDSELYSIFYTPYYNKLEACNNEIAVRQKTIDEYNNQLDNYNVQKEEIQNLLNLKNYLGEELYTELSTHIREDEYTNSNYISDGLDNAQLFEKANEFIKVAQEELVKSAIYQHSLMANMDNLLVMKEFEPIQDKFQLGNWIRVSVDDQIYRLRLIGYEIDIDSLKTLNTTFSDITKTANGMNDVESIIKSAQSMATSYSHTEKQASSGNDAKMTLEKMREEGLNSALYAIQNADTQEMIFDNHGLLGRAYDDISDSYSDEQVKLINNVLAFTTDNWRSVRSALGKMKITLDGTTTYEYGLNSDFVLSGKIIAGDIYSANYSSTNGTGTHFNLTDGTFSIGDKKIEYDGSTLSLKGVNIDYETTEGSLKNQIVANKNEIYSQCTNTSDSNTLISKITQNTESITSEVARASNAETQLSSKITQNANAINLRVTKGDVINQINLDTSGVSINATKINLNGAVTANNYFKINTDGSMETIRGKIGGFTITSNQIKAISEQVGMSSSDYWAFFAGNIVTDTNRPAFCVGHEGNLFASNAWLEGHVNANSGKIGKFTITADGNLYVPVPEEYSEDPLVFHAGINADIYNGLKLFGRHIELCPGKSLTINAAGAGTSIYGDITIDGDISLKSGRAIHTSNLSIGYNTSDRGWADWYSNNNIMIGSIYPGIEHIDGNNGFFIVSRSNPLNLIAQNSQINLLSDTYYYGAFAAASARKYKENIKEITEADANKIMDLTSVEFDYISTGRHAYGLIADDTYKILPQVVGLKDGEPDNIDYVSLIPFMLKKIQMQEKMINKLLEEQHG